MPKIDREEFLAQLEAVSPGLDIKGDVDQSSCFLFKDGKVLTFSGEVACFHDCCLTGVEGVINSGPLLAILREMKGDTLDVEMTESALKISYKKERVTFKLETDVQLPVDVIEDPGDWIELHGEFLEAVALVQECASKDESRFDLTCIHIHPKWLEAADQFQFARYRILTGVEKSLLVKKNHITHIVGLGMTEMSITETWVHFKNPSGVVLSCQYVPYEDYEFPSNDISTYLKMKGDPTSIPRGIADAAKKAGIFSVENPENDQIDIRIKPGKMLVTGKSESGKYERPISIKYSGKPLEFTISPKLLQELVKKNTECEISESILLVNGGKWKWATALGIREKESK